MPTQRKGQTFKFGVDSFEGYMVAGEFTDGTLGEIFMYASKQGSTVAGWADAFAIAFSGALQWSTDPQAALDWLLEQLSGLRFEPHGETGDEQHPSVCSVIEHAMLMLQDAYGSKKEPITT